MVYTRIREICKEQGMPIAELCNRSGVKREAMREWNDHVPAADKLYAVAEVLGTTSGYLLYGKAQGY